MNQAHLSFLALHFIPGVGDYLLKQLISYCGSAEKVFTTPKGKLLKIPGVGNVTATAILQGKTFNDAENEIKKANRDGVNIIFYTDPNYPSRLKQLHDAPSLLYCKGNIDFENPKAIGIVGTRESTTYGKERVEEFVRDLIPHEALIISGLAYGIDIHAHKQAVKNHLPTIGVMGSGIDIVYPGAHLETAKKMMELGGLVTENAFGTKPDAHNFPARNRIIAGLCDALIVVEAAVKGGALITADIANSYNKDVFAFPGNIGQSHSAGCNNLIKANKAHLITSVKDLQYIMNWDIQKVKKKKEFSLEGFESNELSILQTLLDSNGQMMIDEISWKSNVPISQLASILLGLEFKGVVASLPGKIYKVIKI
ncbi:MAG: DNA-protecting protein DprA [Cyclobacteriaceae bacterium]|nr:DNA-protecting protein DprA [Cyclobacteriaceae bacterium]